MNLVMGRALPKNSPRIAALVATEGVPFTADIKLLRIMAKCWHGRPNYTLHGREVALFRLRSPTGSFQLTFSIVEPSCDAACRSPTAPSAGADLARHGIAIEPPWQHASRAVRGASTRNDLRHRPSAGTTRTPLTERPIGWSWGRSRRMM